MTENRCDLTVQQIGGIAVLNLGADHLVEQSNPVAGRHVAQEHKLVTVVRVSPIVVVGGIDHQAAQIAQRVDGDRTGHVHALTGCIHDPAVTQTVEGEVVLGVRWIGIVQVDVARARVRVVAVQDNRVGVERERLGKLSAQEWHERDDGVLFHLA